MSEATPEPTTQSSLAQALKIFAVVVIFIAAQEANQAFTNTFEWSKLMDVGEVARVFMAIVMGFVFGAMQGALRAIQILLAFWSGPSIWGYLGPILSTAAAIVSNATASIVNAFRRKKEAQPASSH